MSAASRLPLSCAPSSPGLAEQESSLHWQEGLASYVPSDLPAAKTGAAPDCSMAFYRKHTEKTLRRYLYASMQVGRTPSVLGNPVGRGWVSSRAVRTFEDALIFVLDVERCLDQLDPLERLLLSRIVLQDYTQVEVAGMLGMAARTTGYKLSRALDRLSEKLLDSQLLVIPE